MPFYPKTSLQGIAHFVSYSKPLLLEDCSEVKAREVAKREMSKVYCSHILGRGRTYIRQIQHSVHSFSISPTELKILGQNGHQKPHYAWHMSSKCSGVRHCEFVPEHMLRPCAAYDNVAQHMTMSISKRSMT